MAKSSRGGRPSPFANPRLFLPIAVVVLGGGYYVFQWWQSGANAAAARQKLLADAFAEVSKEEPDDGQMSQLMAALKKLPDANRAPDVLAARAEIELVRDRPERAYALFGTVAISPGAAPFAQRLGARILLRRHEVFGGDAAESISMLNQVITLSEGAYADRPEPAVLFRAWQAAKRLWAHDRATEIAQRLIAAHADSLEAKLVKLTTAPFDPTKHGNQVTELQMDFQVAPWELSAMHTLVVLMSGDVPEAVRLADANLLGAPGVWTVRFFAAIVFDACVQGSTEAKDRTKWLARRDAQLDWLELRAPPDEPQRGVWQAMRGRR